MDDLITTAEAARMAGIKRSTFSSYVRDGYAPRPVRDGVGLYSRAEVEEWLNNRPGQGYRSDLYGSDRG